MTLLAFAIGVVAGIAIGLALGAKWRNDLRSELEAARQRLMAYNASDTRADLAEVGPVTGQSKPIELYDQDSLAALRTYSLDEVIAEHGFTQAEIDAAEDEHDDQCESEFLNPPGAYTPCGCSNRANGLPAQTLIPLGVHQADDDESDVRALPHGRVSD